MFNYYNNYGDNMREKIIMPIIASVLVGFVMGKFMFNQYDSGVALTSNLVEKESLYFLQQGVYSSIDSMNQNTSSLPYYIYTEEDNKFYVYVGITKDNLEKVKGYYQDKGYDIYIKTIEVSNEAFLEVFNQYEQLLKNTTDENAISAIISGVLAKYEELT